MAIRHDWELDLEPAKTLFQNLWSEQPRQGIVLGSGADLFTQQIQNKVVIPFGDLPGFPAATATGHKGQFVCGQVAQQPVVTMQGRYHCYEGYTTDQVTLPIRLLATLGVKHLLLSNAAGGLNPRFASGDLMLIDSHLNLMFRSEPSHCGDHLQSDLHAPLGANRPVGWRSPYASMLIERVVTCETPFDFPLHRGVYAGLTGPNYETRAEYRMLRKLGADVVGMSTVPEATAASQLGMGVLACSIIANVAKPDVLEPTSGQDVLDAVGRAAPKFCALATRFVETTSPYAAIG